MIYDSSHHHHHRGHRVCYSGMLQYKITTLIARYYFTGNLCEKFGRTLSKLMTTSNIQNNISRLKSYVYSMHILVVECPIPTLQLHNTVENENMMLYLQPPESNIF